jgi:isoleucyl-tRNA synthetase
MLVELNTLMAPILSFLAEEVHSHLKHKTTESVFLNEFPTTNAKVDAAINSDFAKILEVRKEAQKVMEPLRTQKIIGSSLEAHLEIEAPQETLSVLQDYHQAQDLKSELREVLIVSSLSLKLGPALKVTARKASGEKCVRCWIFSEKLNTSTQWPCVCTKCVEALSN